MAFESFVLKSVCEKNEWNRAEYRGRPVFLLKKKCVFPNILLFRNTTLNRGKQMRISK